jgi:hypothetical protein
VGQAIGIDGADTGGSAGDNGGIVRVRSIHNSTNRPVGY